ncbi:MAG: glycoside hydrolase family 25 protein [Candidatus Nanoarchaeia archaeon]|nr:glycoside hydrolase family 25 protein [Candidatus Nanoarchaeia archaeon]
MSQNISKERLKTLNCVLGLDCSKYQTSIDWRKVKIAGIEFAFVKITEGATGHEDNIYNVKNRVLEAQKNNVKIGYYHFARPGDIGDPKLDATAEITNIKNHLNVLPKSNFPIVLDVEDYSKSCILKDKAKNVNVFINTFLGAFDEVSILYSFRLFFDSNTNHTFGMNPLWIANYPKDPNKTLPTLPKGWTEWKIWQFTDKGKIDGYNGNIDLNVMKKDYFDLY